MNYSFQSILYILITSTILTLITSYFLFTRRKAPGAVYFAATALSCFIWGVGYIIEFSGTDLQTKMWGVYTQYFFGIPFTSSFWLAAALHYRSSGQHPNKKEFILLNVIPFLTMILMWTNDLHHFVYKNVGLVKSGSFLLITKEIGGWYYVSVIYSYLMLFAGTVILLLSLRTAKKIYRGQILIFVIASMLPWIGNFLYIGGMNSFMRVDITPVFFTITMVLIGFGMFRYGLFDIVPAARNLVIESMHNGIIVLDYRGRIVDANPAALNIFGTKDIIGRTKDDLFKDLKIKWDIDVSKQSEVFEIEINDSMYELVVTDIKDIHLNTSGKVLTFYNITERKNTEKKLSELNAAKDKLFSIIAHDLKNPFFGLIGLSEILFEDYDELKDEEKKNILNEINQLSRNTHSMLENLLDWSRQQTGRIDFFPQTFDISSLIKETVKIAEQQAKIKSIGLERIVPDKINVYADQNMIATVLRNLISNAIKFTVTGGNIAVSAVIINCNVQIEVKDTGVGISKEIQNKLFRLDSNVKSSGTEGEKGTGLGLLLCKEFVEKNKGTIWVESEPGKGSVFTFTVPLAK